MEWKGVTFPCIHAVWSKWAPPLERSRMSTLAFAGAYAGTVVSMPASGILALAFGWESLFYVFGLYWIALSIFLYLYHRHTFAEKNKQIRTPLLGSIGVVWYIFWVIIVRETPAKDKYISTDELRYIQETLGNIKKADVKHPWKDILRSKPVYAICASHFAENWGFYTMLTQLPTFLKGILQKPFK